MTNLFHIILIGYSTFFVISSAFRFRPDRISKSCIHSPPEEEPLEVCDHVEGYPCRCEANTVNCNHNKLETAYVQLVHKVKDVPVKELWLQSNQISALYKDQIMPRQIRTLTRLHLGSNLICYIEDGAFAGMNRLQNLDLSHNRITHINMETFGLLSSLVQLKLEGNRITNLTGAVFAELPKLKYLYLDENPIGNIDEHTFSDLHELEELTMDNCGLSAIREDWFRGLPKLKTLTLRKNKFLIAPRIHAIPSLRTLDISENPIMELNNHAFHGTPHLTDIVVSKMPAMWAIEDCAFCGLINLQEIQIYSCPKLYYIDPEAFGKRNYFKRELKVVDFADNNLTSLSQDLLPWKNVSSLKLSGNPWHCDCHVSWMNDMSLRYQEGYPVCHGPKSVKDRHVDTLSNSDFKCTSWDRAESGKIFIAITIVLLIAGTVTLGWYMFLTKKTGTRIFNGNPFARNSSLPKYAYRNLAMDSDRDDLNFSHDGRSGNKEGLPPPVEL